MAAILQFRQGSKTSFESSGPFLSEPFYDTDTDILHIGKSGSSTITLVKLNEINSGSLSLSGDLTASNATLSGDITIGGNIILGDSVTDDITISGQLDSNLIPKTDATYDLGSTTKKWNNLHVVSGSIDSIDLTTSLPSGVISGSGQLLSNFDNYINWRVRADNGSNRNVTTNYVVDIQGGDGITTSQTDTSGLTEINVTLDTGSSYFSDAVSSVGAPAGTISGSEQLPGGIISGSEQLPSGVVSGSRQITDGSNLVSSSLQINAGLVANFDLEVKNKMNLDGVLSGSGQLPDGTISGSAQVIGHLPSGTISGSEQVNANTITNFDTNVKSKLDSDDVISGSVQVDVTSTTNYSSVVQTTGNQTIAGDKTFSNNIVISGDLNVDGTTTYTSTNNVNIGDNVIELNYGGSATEGGIYVKDATGGSNTSGSLLWDATNDYWKAGTFGGESELVTDSNILSKLPSGTVSGSSQVNADSITNFDSNVKTKLDLDGIISSSVQVNANTITNFDTNVKSKLDEEGIISGSTQISLSTFSTSNLSEGLNKYYTNVRVKDKLDEEGVISGSSQVNADTIVAFDSNVKDKLDTDGVISGSSQVNYPDIFNIPSGIASGSTQINDLIIGTNYSQSIDTRLLDTFASGSLTSQSLHTLVGHFPTSGGLGTAAFYNVSSSLSDDPSVIPNVKAVYDYINNTIGAADITGVSASLGLSGGGASGYVSLSLDTGSDHFTTAVQGIAPQLPSGVISGSGQLLSNFDNYINWRVRADNGSNRNVTTNYVVDIQGGSGITTSQTDTSGLTEINVNLDTGSTHFSDAVSSVGAPAGTVSGSLTVNNPGGVDVSLDINDEKLVFTSGSANNDNGINVYVSNNMGTKQVSITGYNATTTTKGVASFNGDGFTVNSGEVSLVSGIISGSAITTDGTDLVAIGTSTSNVGDLASGNQLSLYGTSISGLTSFDINGTAKSFDYVASDFRYIDTNSGVGIVLKPNADSGKAWIVDTDGDLVSNTSNTSVTGSVYGANIIARGDLSGSNLLVTGNITVNGTVDGIDISAIDTADVSEDSSNLYYTDTRVKTKLDAEGVISGSTIEGNRTFDDNVIIEGDLTVNGTTTSVNSNTVNIGDNIIVLNSDEAGTPSQDAGVEIERGTSTNARIMWDESEDYWSAGIVGSEEKLLRANSDGVISGSAQITASDLDMGGNKVLFANVYSALGDLPNATTYHGMFAHVHATGHGYFAHGGNWIKLQNYGGLISGSSQVSMGGDLSGNANNTTVDRVQNVSISSGEASQIANIDSVTISNTQWGYLGSSNQGISTTDDVIFNALQISKDNISNGPRLSITNSHDANDWGTGSNIGQISFGTLDSNSARTVATIEVVQEDNTSSYPDETYMVFKTTAAADVSAQEKMRLSADGNLTVKGDVVAYSSSDKRLKDDIIPISNPIEKINSIGGYSFVWNSKKQNIYKGKDYGIIAQEIENVLPELVDTRENGYKSVKYDKLVSLLIEGIKELSQEVKELKEKINKE